MGSNIDSVPYGLMVSGDFANSGLTDLVFIPINQYAIPTAVYRAIEDPTKAYPFRLPLVVETTQTHFASSQVLDVVHGDVDNDGFEDLIFAYSSAHDTISFN